MAESHYPYLHLNRSKDNLEKEIEHLKRSWHEVKINSKKESQLSGYLDKIIFEGSYTPKLLVCKYFQRAFYFYLIEFNGNTILECYGILERCSVNILGDILSVYSDFKQAIRDMLMKKNLDEICKILYQIKVLEEEHYEYSKKLKKHRDIVAHKNYRKSKKPANFYDANKIYSDADTWDHLTKSIDLMVHMVELKGRHLPFYRAAQALINKKIESDKDFTDLLNHDVSID